jgi:hypothetical protein
VPLTLTLYVGVALSSEANAKQPVSVPDAVGRYVIVRVVVEPAETEKLLELEIEYSLLVLLQRVTPLTFSVRVPVFETVTVSCRELPVLTVPNATGFGLAEMVDDELPLTLTLYGLVDAFEVNAMQPVSSPRPLGVYVTVRVVLLPADTEKLLDENVNSLLVPLHSETPLTLSVAVPGFETVSVSCRELPDATFPKASGFGVAEMRAAVVVVVPVPLTLTLNGFVAAFEANAMHPESVPVAVGAYVTVTAWEPPAATENAAVGNVYSVLVPVQRETPVTFRVAFPVFWMVTLSCRVAPVLTLPNASDVGFAAMTGAVEVPVCAVPVSGTL